MNDPDPMQTPQDILAERAALGAILLNPTVAAQALPVLRPEHFYRPWHAKLLEAAQALRAAGRPAGRPGKCPRRDAPTR